ncbi:MAG: protein-L-isoaspartate O-methyltransferase [Gammaproteobacteria bacterium]|nr:protein-L-isoaspartate O-methyltransferase [Gammaproteobacteria bacterium]
MSNLAQAKFNMIEQQIRPWEVLDGQVLAVFDKIEREHFVPEQYKGLAYADCQLPLLKGESMLPPTLEGRMLQALHLKPSDSVLEIGSCSGYITACLATLADQVLSVDCLPEATDLASSNLQNLNNAELSKRIRLQTISSLSDITYNDRFDAITVGAGSLSSIPENLKNALAIGGRLFAVTGQSPVKQAQLVTRISQTEWSSVTLFETDIPPVA